MPSIALCDDDADDLRTVAAIVRRYCNAHPEAALRFEAFPSGSALLDAVRANGPFDLYLLDVVMQHMNGIELGIELRMRDREALIAFVSVSPEFAVDSYKVHAFRYLLKPMTDTGVVALLDEALARFREKDVRALCVKTKEGIQRVLMRDIASAELKHRQIRYHLVDEDDVVSVTLRSSFSEAVAPLLDDDRFVMTSASFVVNVACVSAIRKSAVVLFDGESVPVSRTHRLSVKQAWMGHWIGSPEHDRRG